MLLSLKIKDFALIEDIFVKFGKGLNIITGETGAGKSILVGAMGMLLGDRALISNIRKGAKKSIVEGIFDVVENKKIQNLFKENDLDNEPEMILRREVSLKGSNRCFVNDTPVSLNLLRQVGNLLVDLHGQHEHQSLLRSETHIETLDNIGNYEEELLEFREKFLLLKKLKAEINKLIKKQKILIEKQDLYQFQIKEIDSVSPQIDEEEKLLNELKILENSEKLISYTNEIYSRIYDADDSIANKLGKLITLLNDLTPIDSVFEEKVSESETSLAILNDIADFVRKYRDTIDLESEHLDEIRERIASLNMLKKKFGGSLQSILFYREKIQKELELTENYSERINQLNAELKGIQNQAGSLANKISEKRKKVAIKIEHEIIKTLKYLGINDAQFRVNFNKEFAEDSTENRIEYENRFYKADNNGFDNVEFFISTNLGEDVKQLKKVASGGEISRIMLALKTILAKNDKLPLLIFDEIDTGISGRIAQKVGNSLKSLAAYHQLIVITHLPQIASLADHHFVVEKQKVENRIVSIIHKLNPHEKILEVAKLLSGEKVTEVSINSAKELMQQNN